MVRGSWVAYTFSSLQGNAAHQTTHGVADQGGARLQLSLLS